MSTNPIQLWLFERSPQRQFNALDQLNPEQLNKFESLNGKRQIEFGFTRLLLNHIVRQTLNSNEAFISHERAHLPPSIPCFEEAGWLFSISHSANLITIAVGQNSHANKDNRLGVDLESRHKYRTLAAAKTFFSPRQLSELDNLSDEQQKQHYYLRLWTQKEAYFKARLQPILNPELKSLEISQTQDKAELWSSEWRSEHGNTYQLSLYCNWLAPIEVISTAINSAGQLYDKQNDTLSWESYTCSF